MAANPLVTAVVNSTSPLTLYFGGDMVTAVPATAASSYTPASGDIVRVEVRPNGNLPFVIGKMT